MTDERKASQLERVPTRLLIMRPQAGHELRAVMLPREPTLDELQKLLCPHIIKQWFERVVVLADFDGGTNYQPTDMLVDEDGKMKFLPVNEHATVLYRRYMVLHQHRDPDSLPFIVGPAVLFDRRIWF